MARHRIRSRRGTAAQWSGTNRILRLGELAYETDTKAFKLGDGVTAYNSLPYIVLVQADRFSVVEVASGNHTLVASNLGKMIRLLQASTAQDVAIPLYANLAVAKNTAINICDSVGRGSFTINAWGMVTLIKLDNANAWQAVGAHGTIA
jgi:type III secretory pathway component EscS